jgi:hypothetical protein
MPVAKILLPFPQGLRQLNKVVRFLEITAERVGYLTPY